MKRCLGLFLSGFIILIVPMLVLGDEIVYSQGFEADNGSYAAAGTAQWAWGTPTAVGPSSAHSGLYCWGTNLSGNIPAMANGSLTSPAIALRAVAANETVRASFWLYSYLSTMQDRGEFLTSSDGTNWTSVLKFYEQMSGGWQRYEFDVTPYAGGNLYIQFVANKAYSGGGATPGLYVDDVAITIRTKPAAGTTFTLVGYEDPSSYSSCPWIHTWDGAQFVRDNDIYSVGRNPAGEYTDYYLLQKPLAPREGRYDLEIREIESEDSWTDMVGLLAIDHMPGVGIGPDQAGRIHAYHKSSLIAPSTALDGAGKDVLPQVLTRDDSGYPGYDGGTVDLEFPGADLEAEAHLLVRIKGFIMGKGEPTPYSGPPAVVIEAPAPDGSWREAGRLLPRFEWSEGVFDLAPVLSGRTGGIKVRLRVISHAAKYHEIDYVALAPGAEPELERARQPLLSATAKGSDVRATIEAADGRRVAMHPDESIAVSFAETRQSLPVREFIFISRGYYIPRGGTFLVYTWDGAAWVQRDARSTTGYSDTTMNFDLGLFLPDPTGDFKVRVWQDYKYEGARINFAGLVSDSTAGTLSYARDLRGGGSVDILSQTQANDGSSITYGSGSRDRWSEFRWTGITTELPPTTNPVTVVYPAIHWTYADPQSLPQANYYVEVWTGAGGSGTIMWNPAMGSGTGTSVDYAGTALTPSAAYYARVRAFNGSVWGGWSEASFVAQGASTFSVSASAGANGALDASTPSPVDVASGGTASFKFNANEGFHVTAVSGCGGASYANASNSVTTYTFTTAPISGACTVSATFAINTYAITSTAGANGSIDPAGVTTVSYDGSQTYSIAPAAGFHVADVQVDGSSVGAVTTYTFSEVRAAHTIEVSFAADPTAPDVTTAPVSDVALTSAASGGNVTSDGGSAVTARGICWSSAADPTTADSHTSDGAGTGGFASAITGLTPGTTYHVRAYATNSVGTAYGGDVSFTTTTTAPTVTTTAANRITATSASSGGNVTSDGGSAVTARGVCWSATANPTTADTRTSDGTGTGAFVSSITGLSPSTKFHIRAYATNSAGTGYGTDMVLWTRENPSISGTIRTPEGAGLENVTVTFSGAAGTALSGADGRYSRVVTYGWTGTITPSLPGYAFGPASRSYTNVTASRGDQDFTITQGAPSISILTPAAGGRLAGTVEVCASAEDPDGISRTEILIDGACLSAAEGRACTFSWNTADAAFGEHVIRAVAYDAGGLSAAMEIKVTVDNPPSLRILSPRDGPALYGRVEVTASVSDDQSVAGVEFFVDGRGIGAGTPASPGIAESGFRKAASTHRAGIGTGAESLAEGGGTSLPAEHSGPGLVYIDGFGGLRRLGATGTPERVLEGDPRVLYVRPDAGNVLFAVFDEPQAVDDGRACRLAAVDFHGGTIAGAETGDLHIRTDFRSNPAIQFDGLGNAYYIVRTPDGTESLRTWDGGSETVTLFGAPARVAGWLIDPDGTALVYGSDREKGSGWLYRIDRSGNRVAIAGPGIEALWALGIADGGAYVRLADLAGTAASGIYRFERNATPLTESRARTPLVGREDHRFSPRLGTAGFPEPVRAAWDGMGLAAWTGTPDGAQFALLKGSRGESLILELDRQPRPIDVRSLDEVSFIRAAGDCLLASGLAGGKSRLISIELATGRETVLIGADLRIDRVEVLADGRPAFQAYAWKSKQVLIGVLAAASGQGASSGYEILASLGPAALLGFEALNGARSATATETSDPASAARRSASFSDGDRRGSARDGGSAARKTEYSIVWDTSSLANGARELKAVATDPAGQTSSDSVVVNVQNLSLTLDAYRRQVSSWLVTREYGEIRFGVQNPGAIPVVKYSLYRSAGTGSRRLVKEFPAGQMGPSGLVYLDKYLEKGVRYIYQAVAVLADGSAAGSSQEKTI